MTESGPQRRLPSTKPVTLQLQVVIHSFVNALLEHLLLF